MQEESLTVVNINAVFLYGKIGSQGNKSCQDKKQFTLQKDSLYENISLFLFRKESATVVEPIVFT